MNNFEKAAIVDLHFKTIQGMASVGDLYTMPLSMLDDTTIELSEELGKGSVKSFIKDVKTDSEILQLKFDIAKHVIDYRLAEIEKQNNEKERKEEIQRILAAINKNKSAEMDEKTTEELMKDLNKLQA